MADPSAEPQVDALDEPELLRGATFFPDDEPGRLDRLLEAVWLRRYTSFVTIYMELRRAAPVACDQTGFSAAGLEIIGAPSAVRQALVDDPAFLAWMHLALAALNRILTGRQRDRGSLRRRVAELPEVLRRIEARRADPACLRLPGTSILVQRFDIDPLIAQVAPPSYKFPVSKERRRVLERQGHSLSFFREVTAIAAERIARTWPACHEHLTRLVKVIGYLPDASFRSCSASRYTGVVYLTAKDPTLLDMEESLVHEAGHQLLYNIVEAAPITRDDVPVEEQYTLPWSGQRRDFYGYFHAFFIYLLLVKYYERVEGRSAEEQHRASRRLGYILSGLLRALPDFQGNKGFSPMGARLLDRLAGEVHALARRHRPALDASARAAPEPGSISAVE